MSALLTHVQELTPQWLSNCLGRTLNLDGNRVVDIEVVKTRETNISSAYFLQVTYASPDAALPSQLFLKLPVPGQSLDREEIEFYTALAPKMASAFPTRTSPFVACFDAAYSANPERSHLLLADMSATHFTNEAKLPPSHELCCGVIDAYAQFHAFWWEHPWLGKQIGNHLTHERIDSFIGMAQAKLSALREVVTDELTAHQLAILSAAARAWPTRRRERVVAGKGVTIVHRDPHPLNFLYPNDPATDCVKLIDWQSWRVDSATDDLAYMMACHWPLDENPGLEQEMLARYFVGLQSAGIQGYGQDDLLYDYRASIIRCLFFLLISWSPRHWSGTVWKGRVRRSMDAFERFDCGELLG